MDKLGRTLLHHSARLGYRAAIKLLINKGLIVIIKDNNRRIARDLAKGLNRAIKAFNSEELDFYIYKNYIILL
jgi:ankyrin repeat protein